HALTSSLVSKEYHFFVGERVGGVPYCGLNILTRKTGKGAEQISVSRPLAQFAKDKFNRDPRSTNHRFAKHYLRIDLDTTCYGHTFPSADRIHRFSLSAKPSVHPKAPQASTSPYFSQR